jgi:hypothetical protein
LPSLSSGTQPQETGTAEGAPVSLAPVETTIIVPGTPTEVYAQVARGALNCWFGRDGPLKATHIFTAEAASPTQGGAAAIVVHERDVDLHDQRGVRAFRISFTGDPSAVRVGITNLKMTGALGQLMVGDAETWAKGGEGCQVRTLSSAAPARQPARVTGVSPHQP